MRDPRPGWRDFEIWILERFYGRKGIKAKHIADVLGRTPNSIRKYWCSMSKETKRKVKPWTKQDEDFAVKNIGPMTAKQIGEKLGRSTDSVRVFIKRYDDMRLCR